LCKIESIDNPLLRETLTQYIVLVKQLTGQARSREMEKEILDIIVKDAGNVEAAFLISQNINEVKVQLLKDKFMPLMEKIEKENGVVLDDYEDSFEEWFLKDVAGFSFKKPEWKNFKIIFEFEKGNLQGFFYGFRGKGKLPQNLDKYLRSLKESKEYKDSDDWPFWHYVDHYRNWDDNFFKDLSSSPDNIKKVFKNIIKEILLIVENKGFEL
jgi:hypothetical protein